jgi:hypothetical protein
MFTSHAPANTEIGTDRRQFRRALPALVTATAVFSLLAGYVLFQDREVRRFPLRPMDLSGAWVQAGEGPNYTGFFRHAFNLDGTVTHAWVAIAACDGFEISVNRDAVARHHAWRPTRPFQNGLSERGQCLGARQPLMDLNFPREYQWSGHDSFRLPVLVDIRPELRPGRNVICVQIESRTAPARFALIGAIKLANGRTVALRSGNKWRAMAVASRQGSLDWTDVEYRDRQWPNAVAAAEPRGQTWQHFDSRAFTAPFRGPLLESPQATAADPIWYRWQAAITRSPRSAWIRLLTNRRFDLFINGQPVAFDQSYYPDPDTGQWIMGREAALDPHERPSPLDPDELDSPFVGTGYEQPESGDPTRTDFRSLPLATRELRLHGSSAVNRFTEKHGSVWSPELDPAGHLGALDYPHGTVPTTHHHDRRTEYYVAYDVSRLVRLGHNEIEIRLAQPDTSSPPNWTGRVAVDGGIGQGDGSEISVRLDENWQTRVDRADNWQPAVARRISAAGLASVPRLQFRGVADDPAASVVKCGYWQLGMLCGVSGLIGTLLSVVGRIVPCQERANAVAAAARLLVCILACSASILAVGLLVRAAFAERHEALWFYEPGTWMFLLLTALWWGILAALVDLSHRRARATDPCDRPSVWRQFPTTPWWRLLVGSVLLLSLGVRAYRLDFQPLDDDEYASTQAIVNIARSGIPTMAADDVWYTRSPLFHYGLGGVAAVWGPNLWSMRLPNVLCGVITCGLTYAMGSRVLKRPWVGLGAMLLLAMHPFEVYTSHVIRFYQMQQMMALLTIYCFCRGFIVAPREGYRLATILAFLATVLCQEVSCVMGCSLLLCYVALAEPEARRGTLRLLGAATCAAVLIALDYLAFESRCMTRPAGISPNLEASFKPHLWHPYNLLALGFGYSRLHLIGSCFLLLGLPLCCRRRNRAGLALALILASGVVLTNVLVTHVSLRYQYWLIPLWTLLAMEGLREIAGWVAAFGIHRVHEVRQHRRLTAALASAGFVGCLVGMSPWRMCGSYETKLVGDATGALQYIRVHLRPEDAVMVTEPHTHAALLEVGRVDYDLSVPLLYDFAMLKAGELIDRNAGANVIGNVQQLADVLRSHPRLWIAVNHEKLRSRGKNLRWEYPGARIESYLRQNCQLAHKTYLWSVYLWDAGQGAYAPFRSPQR